MSNETIMTIGCFLLGATLTSIYGFIKGVLLATSLICIIVATEWRIEDEITEDKIKFDGGKN